MRGIESRASPTNSDRYELLLSLDIAPKQLLKLIKSMRQANFGEVSILRETRSLTVQGTAVSFHYFKI